MLPSFSPTKLRSKQTVQASHYLLSTQLTQLLHITMSRKHRQIKGQQPPQRKTERKQHDLVTRGRIITLRKEGYTERAIEQKLDVPHKTVHNIYRHALQQSMKF